MLVSELIALLQSMPQDVAVEVNDNAGGQIIEIDSVDFFPADGTYTEVVVIQANCE